MNLSFRVVLKFVLVFVRYFVFYLLWFSVYGFDMVVRHTQFAGRSALLINAALKMRIE